MEVEVKAEAVDVEVEDVEAVEAVEAVEEQLDRRTAAEGTLQPLLGVGGAGCREGERRDGDGEHGEAGGGGGGEGCAGCAVCRRRPRSVNLAPSDKIPLACRHFLPFIERAAFFALLPRPLGAGGESLSWSMLQAAGASLQAAGPSGPSLVERGERHAGNNFFQAVLRVNFPGITEHNGCDSAPANSAKYYCCWTHGYANDECAQYFNPPLTAFAFLTRSPYSWLVAMHSEPYEHDGAVPPSFSEFLRAPFSYTPGSYASGPKDEQPNPVQLWAAKVDSYRSVTMPAANLTHLDLYDEEALTQRLAPLTAGGDFYQSPQERMLIEPVLAAAMNDKMDGSFSREEFNGAREYEEGREWLQCAPPRRPLSPLGPPPVSNQCPRIPCLNVHPDMQVLQRGGPGFCQWHPGHTAVGRGWLRANHIESSQARRP